MALTLAPTSVLLRGLLSVSLWLIACSDCPDRGLVAADYIVTVRDAASGAPICDATVEFVQGGLATVDDCSYRLGIPPEYSTVTMLISRPGYVSTSKELSTRHGEDECGDAESVRVDIKLEKQ